MTPGDGWQYFIRQIATGDERRVRGRDLSEHQAAIGAAPGQWVGRAAATLGVSGTVTEPQMRALFGEGLHPRADDIIDEQLQAGVDGGRALRAARLGAGFSMFGASQTPLEKTIAEEIGGFEKDAGRAATAAERGLVRRSQGAVAFLAEYRMPPKSGAELDRYI